MSSGALLVDFGGTLDADGDPWVERFFRGYREVGGAADRPEFGTAFAWSDVQLAQLPGITTFDYSTTVTAQVDLLAALLPDGARLRSGPLRASFVAAAQAAAARNRSVLLALSADYRLAVVSNYQGNLQPCLDELGLGDVFDVVADSEVVGARKPGRRIFEATLAALGSVAEACWMVGDSPPNDIAPAAALGMRTCWLAPAVRVAVGITPTARVARFDQLPHVLAA